MNFNKKQAYEDNFNAIQEIFQASQQRRKINTDILKKYVGYGALKEILENEDSLEKNKGMEL